jgi:peptidoglycan/xylan/chitin deacetylase (PgdA/CDA1 family)
MISRSIKQVAKAVLSPMVDATGFYRRRIASAIDTPGRWTIAMYHRVIEDPAQDPFALGMCITRTNFERQLRYLGSSFNFIGVNEAIRRIKAGDALPERALSITFDDGYLDNLTTALPILKALAVPYSIYIPTGGLDTDEMLWWDRVIAALACTGKTSVDLQAVGLAERSVVLPLAGSAAAASADQVLALLWSHAPASVMECVRQIEQYLAPYDAAQVAARRLTSQQIVELHRLGADIGAHSVSHPNLGMLNVERTRQEMVESREYLENLLQSPVPGFAYPGGRMVDATSAMAKEVGFDYALATEVGVNPPAPDLFTLRRIGMPDTGMADFRRAFGAALARESLDNLSRF